MIKRQYALSIGELAELVVAHLSKRETLTGKVTRCEMQMHHLEGSGRVFVIDLDIEEPKPEKPAPDFVFPIL